jgi:TIGR03009 family protein
MNWRGLPQLLLIALISLNPNLGFDSKLFAQSNPSGRQRLKRDRLQGIGLQVQRLSPELERILREWSEASNRIQKLQGSHSRWVYDHTYEVEKQASGIFYYESPDKGRIDIVGQNKPFPGLRRKFKNMKPDNKNGKVYQFKPDLNVIWIADGGNIKQIDSKLKTVEVFPIPPESQGKNIMDGPLPFLFGMPPEKAKQRFRFVLLGESETKVWLQIWPNFQQDRANWREAKVILHKPSYLPEAVQLIDPAGTTETDYRFHALSVNKPRTLWNKIIGSRDWTNPKLSGKYETHINEPKPTRNEQNRNLLNRQQRQQQPTVPSVVNLNYDEAKRAIRNAGYYVKFEHGTPTANPNQLWRVEAQSPRQGTPLQKRKTVTLRIMPPRRREDRHTVPTLLGVGYEEAEKKLNDAGYKFIHKHGSKTTNKELIHKVQYQNPLPNEPLSKGEKVTLYLFYKPASTAQKNNRRSSKQ